MKYMSLNIGDEIQSIAAKRFLPHIDDYVFRERLNSFRTASAFKSEPVQKFKIILNGWYMHVPQNFPPSIAIEPLLISMHFDKNIRRFILNKAENVNYLKEHGPVGCRDIDTMNFLLEHGIPAYHSGCLTLTLTENKIIKASANRDYVLCVDVPDEVIIYVKSKTNKPVYALSKIVNPYVESIERLELAKIYLYMYHNASAVITSNLHTALPCLAMNTSVCLLNNDDRERFSGLEELVNHYPQSDFLAGAYDINNPPENPRDFIAFRDSLINTCRNFTGYDSGKPTLDDKYTPDIISMLHMLQYDYRSMKRAAWFLKGRDLLKAVILKLRDKFFLSAISSKTPKHTYEYNKYYDTY